MSEKKYNGGCYCGAVRFEVTGQANAQVCHCSICRQLQGSSFGLLAAFFDKSKFEITEGKELQVEYLSPMKYSRNYCPTCGTRTYMGFEKAPFEMPYIALYPTVLDEVKTAPRLPEEFSPTRHIYYADRLYDIKDGLPKFVDMPSEYGGSGKQITDTGDPIS